MEYQTIDQHVRFDNRSNYHPRRTGLNVNHIKFDLLKISELYDGVLTDELGELPLRLYNAYLTDLVRDKLVYEYGIDMPEARVHEATGEKSFTYTVHVQSAYDRAFKSLKIHIGCYNSINDTHHIASGKCCMPTRS